MARMSAATWKYVCRTQGVEYLLSILNKRECHSFIGTWWILENFRKTRKRTFEDIERWQIQMNCYCSYKNMEPNLLSIHTKYGLWITENAIVNCNFTNTSENLLVAVLNVHIQWNIHLYIHSSAFTSLS